MKRNIIINSNSGFVQYISTPLVADDVQAYEIILNADRDITGCSFTVTATRADGVKVVGAGTVSGNTAKYTLENNMHSVPSVMTARLTLIDQLGSVLTDHELHFDVVDGNGDPDLSGDDRVPALNQIIINATAASNSAAAAAGFAQTQGENAQEMAALAKKQGDYAKEQGDYAKSKGDDFPIPTIANDGDVLTVGKRQEGDEPHTGLTYVNIGSTSTAYRLVANYSKFDIPVTENSLVGLRMTATLHLQDFGTFDVDSLIQANEIRTNNQTVIVIEKPADKPSTKQGDSFENLMVYTPKYVPAPEWKEINLDEKLAGKADKQTADGGFVGGKDAYATNGGAIGEGAMAHNGGGAVGYGAKTIGGGGSIGESAKSFGGGAVGYRAFTGAGFAGGAWATTLINGSEIDAVQLGKGNNEYEHSLQVYSYQLMDANGKIPSDRLPNNFNAIYDIIIDSQSKWDRMVADGTWNGVKSVAITCDLTLGGPVTVPQSVLVVDGINSPTLSYTELAETPYNNRFKFGYATAAPDGQCRIMNITINVDGDNYSAASYGFVNMKNVYNCSAIIKPYSTGGDNSSYGFSKCTNLYNCYSDLDHIAAGQAINFEECYNLTNCECNLHKSTISGFNNCNVLSGCKGYFSGDYAGQAFYGCSQIVNCTVHIVESCEYGTCFSHCSYLSNCKSVGPRTGITIWEGPNTKRDDDSCDLE